MEVINNALGRSLNYLSSIGIADIIDILVVAFIIYRIIELIRMTNAYNLAKGLIIFLLFLGVSDFFKLTMINYMLRKAVEIGLVALVVLFQPELRHFLERIGSKFSSGIDSENYSLDKAIEQTVSACTDMSASKTGALLVFERKMNLNEMIKTGTEIDSEVSSELLKNLFYNKAPLHDGAVIVENGRISAAGCVLPLSKNNNLSKDLGMRHRAGIGLSENTDSVVVIVSEETGAISVAIEGTLKRHLSPDALETILKTELLPKDTSSKPTTLRALISYIFKVEKHGEQ